MQKNVRLFLLLALGMTALFIGTLAVFSIDVETTQGMVLLVLGGSVPTVLAFAFVHRGASDEKTHFYHALWAFRRRITWYALALLVPVVLGALGFVFRFGEARQGGALTLWPVLLLSGILFGGLEEIGWRGFVQARVCPRNLIVFGVAFGVFWAVWHLPMFFVPTLAHAEYAFFPYLLVAVVYSLWLTWLYAKTASLPLVVLFHAAINATASVGLSVSYAHTVGTYVYAALALALTVLWVAYDIRRNANPTGKAVGDEKRAQKKGVDA